MITEVQEKVAAILAVGILIVVVIATVAMFFIPIPEANQTIVGQAYGGLVALLGICVSFFYGTSTGNRKDKDIIATQADAIQKAQTTLSAQTTTPGQINLAPGAEVKVHAEDSGDEHRDSV